ncbi:MAG: glutamate--cysteine ligase [Alphaproteobacteria bacterium]|nr:glutamate--cysteine ligase [Alphaproteobacteria bacterium]
MTLHYADMLTFFNDGIKAPEKRGIGIESECFLYDKKTGYRLDYDHIRLVLEAFLDHGYTPVFEGGNIIGGKKNGSSLSLEPGGQFELSAKVHKDLHAAHNEISEFKHQLDAILSMYGFFRRDIGFEPLWAQRDLPWMPKGRYAIMRDYMLKKGNHGLDMMRRTCTLQINLDYISEANMAMMMFVSNALNPITSGLFAASPFYEGAPSGYKSFRNFVWQDTDPDRCGLLPFAFKTHNLYPAMTFDDYVDYLLRVPMYFIYRNGYINGAGESFLDFMEGKLASYPGHFATTDDFYDQITVPFPEVRLKQFIEIRGIDASPKAFSSAALFVGLFYSETALQKIFNHVKDWTFDTVQAQYLRIPRDGLSKEEWGVAEELYTIAREGLSDRGLGEEIYLTDLEAIILDQKTQSDVMLDDSSGCFIVTP